MKKITTLFVAAVSIFAATQLMSCKKDKNETKIDPIVGTWNSQSVKATETTNGVETGSFSIDLPGFTIYTFNSDKSYKESSAFDPTESTTGTYQTIDSKLIFNYKDSSGASESDTYDYQLSENSLILNDISTEITGSDTVVSTTKITFKRG